MKLRSLLLAGTVLPFAMSYPAQALDRASSNTIPWQLAQVEEVCPEGEVCPPVEGACPEGEVCPPIEGQQPAPEAPAPGVEAAPEPVPPEPEMEATPLPEETIIEEAAPEQVSPAPEMEAPPLPEETIIEETPPEQVPPTPEVETVPPPEEIIIEEAPPEQVPPAPEMETAPPPEETIIEETPPEQVPPAPEMETAPPPEETIIEETPPEQVPPAPDMEITPPPEQVPPTADETGMPPVEETTTEQQLEAQGDDEEAGRVRNLRNRLLEQLEDVLVPGEPRNRRRGYDNRYDEGDVVDRRGGSVIIDLGGGNIYVEPVVPDDGGRLLYGADNIEVQELEGGRTRTIVYRRDGVQIVTLRDRYGDIIRRTKILPNGREIVLIDNRFPEDYDATRPPILSDLPPPIIGIPEDQYIVDLGVASYDDLRGALLAPPVQPVERAYTLDEVLRNEGVRAYSPRIDLDSITFEFGSSTIANDQMRSLADLGRAMEDILAEHPDEVYLIEGHTDAVGSDYDNLILSDRRSEAVAVALSQNFNIPPENLITQGYGEQYLKVNTDGPEQRNRRATVRRVTELLQAQNQ